MATVEQALYYELVNTSAISTLIGNRLYPAGDVPQDTARPYITWSLISRAPQRHQTGAALYQSRYQFTVTADTMLQARAVGQAIRTKLDRDRQDMGEAGSTVAVRGAFIEDSADMPGLPGDGGQRGPQQHRVDVFLWHATE